MRFEGKKVFISGASKGIGKSIANAFLDEGAFVFGSSTGGKKETSDFPNCQEWFFADFNDIDQIKKCADFLRKIEPDILINNAGINKIAPFVSIEPEDFLSIHRVNVFAPFLLCQSVLPSMILKSWGRIVNISSIWGKISKEQRASYSSSKFAIDGMTIALAAEHSMNGILANCVAPGFTDTELTRRVLGEEGIRNLVANVPIRRIGTVDEIARLVLWLSSEENSYVTGQNISIDGGFTRV
ncbi:SDR family NAD(P)-dependent oxidoreductase [Leptospira stimsonii]|uniref:Dehydrogenase n=1 Tax=Leptospira stimsonii TaxID=2202203 RepID=A0A4V6QMI5_9LEPT|nr:SDR family oxidoreductase [Leptospira stimsonii]RHX86320.1 dehydrogenase [Leptospira stimsonii]TGK14557.1 SDR family oxidoreductase [Leptospira stimsonii]TGM09980.1 SDR family oxidoreductase [Leptospira stimsonii]